MRFVVFFFVLFLFGCGDENKQVVQINISNETPSISNDKNKENVIKKPNKNKQEEQKKSSDKSESLTHHDGVINKSHENKQEEQKKSSDENEISESNDELTNNQKDNAHALDITKIELLSLDKNTKGDSLQRECKSSTKKDLEKCSEVFAANNYRPGDRLKAFVQYEHKDKNLEAVFKCKWFINGEEQKNSYEESCIYQLKKDEYLKEITVEATAFAEHDSSINSAPTKFSFKKIFPIAHASNSAKNLVLYSNGKLGCWNTNIDAYKDGDITPSNCEKLLSDEENNDFVKIDANEKGLAAVKRDGSLYTWFISEKNELVRNISFIDYKTITHSNTAFAVLSQSNKVTILNSDFSKEVENTYTGIKSAEQGFLLTNNDKHCLFTDDNDSLGECIDIPQEKIKQFISLSHKDDYLTSLQHYNKSNSLEFALLTEDGELYYAREQAFFSSTKTKPTATNVKSIIANNYAFTYIYGDDSTNKIGMMGENADLFMDICEGDKSCTNNLKYTKATFIDVDGKPLRKMEEPQITKESLLITNDIDNVSSVSASVGSFAALTKSGEVITWGFGETGGDIYNEYTRNGENILAKAKSLGTEGDSGAVILHSYKNKLSTNVKNIFADNTGFTAFGNSAVTWGHWTNTVEKNNTLENTGLEGNKNFQWSSLSSNIGGKAYSNIPWTVASDSGIINRPFKSNGRAFVSFKNDTPPEFKSKIFTWGDQLAGSRLDVNGNGGHQFYGYIKDVFADKYGFTFFTEDGRVYILVGTEATADSNRLIFNKTTNDFYSLMTSKG